MKSLVFFSALALGRAFVLPDEQAFSELAVEQREKAQSLWNELPSPKELADELSHAVGHTVGDVVDSSLHMFDSLVEASTEKSNYFDEASETAFDVNGWLAQDLREEEQYEQLPLEKPPHHGPPHHGPPHHGPPHHHKPNMTVYELIAKSKHTTKLAKLINEYDDLVDLLNGTSANFTVFAPTDKAFEKIPKKAPKPSKEFLKKLLTYHVSSEFYPAARVFKADTIPTSFKEPALGENQRIAVKLGLKGLVLNFYAGVAAPNIFGTNGVIHGIESILVPPPPQGVMLNLLPADFSTLLLALERTGLDKELNKTAHVGGTLFAPSNLAFKKLGPGPNAFLFSKHGLKYLKALLKYHVVINETLYSDYFHRSEENEATAPRRHVQVSLPTLLDGHSMLVDIERFGPFINMRVNGYGRVVVKNGIAKDGVVHVVGDVLIPPKKVGSQGEAIEWNGEEMSEQELKERLEPFVEEEQRSGDGVKWEM